MDNLNFTSSNILTNPKQRWHHQVQLGKNPLPSTAACSFLEPLSELWAALGPDGPGNLRHSWQPWSCGGWSVQDVQVIAQLFQLVIFRRDQFLIPKVGKMLQKMHEFNCLIWEAYPDTPFESWLWSFQVFSKPRAWMGLSLGLKERETSNVHILARDFPYIYLCHHLLANRLRGLSWKERKRSMPILFMWWSAILLQCHILYTIKRTLLQNTTGMWRWMYNNEYICTQAHPRISSRQVQLLPYFMSEQKTRQYRTM